MKYTSATYLKDITDYNFSLFYDIDKKYYITVKKINEIKEPFILNEDGELIKILDNNYYILEFIPLNENYICRIHIDKEKKVIEKVFTVSKSNKFKNGIPTYEDLKLSLICINNKTKTYNLDVLSKLVESEERSVEEYELAKKVIKQIENEIKNNCNFIFNLNYLEYLK